MRFPLESTAISIERATGAGSIFLPELSPCWNLFAMNFLCLSVNLLTLLKVLDLSAQPCGNASLVEGGCSEQLSCGWAWHCTSSFCAYPQSKCRYICYGTDFVYTASAFLLLYSGMELQHTAVAGSQLSLSLSLALLKTGVYMCTCCDMIGQLSIHFLQE